MAFDLAPDYKEDVDLARFYSNNGEYEGADRIYRKVIEADPNNAQAYTEWARVLVYMGEGEEAMKKYKKAYEGACSNSKSPNITDFRKTACTDVLVQWAIGLSIKSGGEVVIGRYEEAAKDEEEALKKYQEGASIDPKNPEIYAQWGYELALQAGDEKAMGKDDQEADAKYHDAICKFKAFANGREPNDGCNPKEFVNAEGKPNADFYNYWGTVLGMMKEYDRAIEKRKKAIEIDLNYFLAYYYWGVDLDNLANLYSSESNSNEASEKSLESISKYKQSLYINPKYAPAYFSLGFSLGALGRYDEAINQYEKAIELNSKYLPAYGNWGYSLEQLGKYREAIKKYKEVIKLNPVSVLAYKG